MQAPGGCVDQSKQLARGLVANEMIVRRLVETWQARRMIQIRWEGVSALSFDRGAAVESQLGKSGLVIGNNKGQDKQARGCGYRVVIKPRAMRKERRCDEAGEGLLRGRRIEMRNGESTVSECSGPVVKTVKFREASVKKASTVVHCGRIAN